VCRTGRSSSPSDHFGPPLASGDTMINTPDRQNNRKIVAMDDTLADPLTGRLLDGRYAVTARIAHGGMATVYRATDTRLDREVALKVMHAELARDEEFVRRFIGEAKSVARLSQENVVAVYDLPRALSVAGHTRAGLLIGTVAYVPPEQVTGGATGPRGDVYSAGVMLFELLTGRLPFTGDTPLSIAYQHVNADVPAPSV